MSKICNFNFNNEVDSFEIVVEDDGRVIIPAIGPNGEPDMDTEPDAVYDSVQQLAEIYAQARDVKPENLKNWTLVENGDTYSFVLRAGTAGVNVSEVEDRLEEVFQNLSGDYHPLNVARAKEQIMADGAVDLTDALVHCTEGEIARDVYDAMFAEESGEEAPAEEAPVEEEDTRSDLEKFMDEKAETPGALAFIAVLVGLPADSEKAAIMEAINGNIVLSNVGTLRAAYDNNINDAINNGIGVTCEAEALTVLAQIATGNKMDEAAKRRMIYTTRMAGRNKMNVSVDIIGEKHIRHTAEQVSLDELEAADLFMRGNAPYIVRFSDEIDAEIETEQAALAAANDDGAVVENGDFDEYADEEDTGYYSERMYNGSVDE